MPTTEVTNAQVITVLKHLASGRQPDFAAQVTHLPQPVVEKIAEDYEWPDLEQVRAGIFRLSKAELDLPKSATAPEVARPAAPATQPPQGRPDLSTAQKAPTPTPPPAKPVDILVRASQSEVARTRALGEKIGGLLDDLRGRLRQEDADREARATAKAEQEQKAKRIAELEAELSKLKGKKAASTAATAAAGDSKAIRAWAAQNNVACPPVGRVPATVREAYDNAHTAKTA